jgi:hypothetical protein
LIDFDVNRTIFINNQENYSIFNFFKSLIYRNLILNFFAFLKMKRSLGVFILITEKYNLKFAKKYDKSHNSILVDKIKIEFLKNHIARFVRAKKIIL